MTDTTQDFLMLSAALKSNYRKGLHRFETLLSSPSAARDFAATPGMVQVVCGYPIGKPDKTSDALLKMLWDSSVIDAASETLLKTVYTYDSLDTFVSSKASEVYNNPLLWRTVKESPVVGGKIIAKLAGQNPASFSNVSAVAASSTAMAAVAASSTAMAAVAASSTAMAAVAASSTAICEIWKSSTAVAKIKANSSAWATFSNPATGVLAKALALILGKNTSATEWQSMSAVAASSTAMSAVAASSTAMSAVAASSTAMSAVESSSTAKNALASSPLKQSVLVEATNTWTNRRSGKIWLISVKQTWSGPSNHTMQHRYTLNGNNSISCTCQVCYNTNYRLDRFMGSLTNYCSAGGIGNCCTYYFIPIS